MVTEAKPKEILELEKEIGKELTPVGLEEIITVKRKLFSYPPEDGVNRYTLDGKGKVVGLCLAYNGIVDISFLENFTHLTHLKLLDNQIKNLSPLQKLTNLTDLGISINQIQDISPLQKLTNLTILILSENQIVDISPLQNLTNLTELNLSDNQIVDISPLQKLINLTILILSENQIVDISPLQNLTNLPNLVLSNNQIKDISPLQNLTNLTSLSLSENQIVDISPLQNLTNLAELSLSDNQIKDILFLQNLIHLIILQLSSNKIQDISPLQKLIHLRFLHLSNNQIQDISLDFLNQFSDELWNLNLSNNPINGIPKECLGSSEYSNCFDSLKDYLSKPREYIYEAKLLLLGEASAGKTSLMKKLLDPKVALEKEESTHGINLETWEFPYTNPKNTPLNPDFNGMFKAHILDFGGQDILQHTHRYFMRDRSLYLLVVNARESESYDWDKWLRTVRFYGGSDVPIYIVFNNKEKELMNPQLEKKWKDRFGISKVFHIDLKDDRNLDSLVEQLKLDLQSLPHIGTEQHLIEWRKIESILLQEAETENTIDIDHYVKICKGIGIYEEDSIGAAKLLDLLGNILYFSNDKLNHTIILRKEWATEAAYEVYWNKSIRKLGKFYRSELKSILGDSDKFPRHQYDFLLSLMDQFGIAYQSKEGEKEVFIVPAHLDIDPPTEDYKKYHTGELRRFKLVFKEYMPKGILILFIVRTHQLIYEQVRWKKGVLLNLQTEVRSSQPTLAEIVENNERNKQEIEVVLSGERPKEAFSILYKQYLLKVIEEIDINRQLKPVLEVGCLCDKCKNSEEPHYFEYDSLLERQRKGKVDAECYKGQEDLNVRELLAEFDLPPEPKDKIEEILDKVIEKQEHIERRTRNTEKRSKAIHKKLENIEETTDAIDQKLDSFFGDFNSYKQKLSSDLNSNFNSLSNLIIQKVIVPNEPLYEKQLDNQLGNQWKVKLDPTSQKYLITAEYLFDYFSKISISDYSPAIIQYCRTVENELKLKVYEQFITIHLGGQSVIDNEVSNSKSHIKSNSSLGFNNGDCEEFHKGLSKENSRSLENMQKAMKKFLDIPNILTDPNTFQLFKDYEIYLNNTLDKSKFIYQPFIKKIGEIKDNYRNKSAHGKDTLTAIEMQDCKQIGIMILQEWIHILK